MMNLNESKAVIAQKEAKTPAVFVFICVTGCGTAMKRSLRRSFQGSVIYELLREYLITSIFTKNIVACIKANNSR